MVRRSHPPWSAAAGCRKAVSDGLQQGTALVARSLAWGCGCNVDASASRALVGGGRQGFGPEFLCVLLFGIDASARKSVSVIRVITGACPVRQRMGPGRAFWLSSALVFENRRL